MLEADSVEDVVLVDSVELLIREEFEEEFESLLEKEPVDSILVVLEAFNKLDRTLLASWVTLVDVSLNCRFCR